MWLSGGKAFQAEGIARTNALKREHAGGKMGQRLRKKVRDLN